MNKKKNTEENGEYGETTQRKASQQRQYVQSAKKSRSLIRKMEARASLQIKQKIHKNSRVEQHCVSKKFHFF